MEKEQEKLPEPDDSADANNETAQAPKPKHVSSDEDQKKQREPFARAAREDDDGYDPWSDRTVQEPFWEKDPWD